MNDEKFKELEYKYCAEKNRRNKIEQLKNKIKDLESTINYLDKPYAKDKYTINAVGEFSSDVLINLGRKETKNILNVLLKNAEKELVELNHETKN